VLSHSSLLVQKWLVALYLSLTRDFLFLCRSHNFVSAVKSRLAQSATHQRDLYDIWQKSFSGLSDNLEALALMPFAFPERVPGREFTTIDPAFILASMRDVTSALVNATEQRRNQGRTQRAGVEGKTKKNDSEGAGRAHYIHPGQEALANTMSICDDSTNSANCPGCKSLPRLLLAFTKANVTSLPGKSKPENGAGKISEDDRSGMYRVSWSGIAVAGSFYFCCVLKFWNAGQAIKPNIFRKMVQILRKESEKYESRIQHSLDNAPGNMWFWKVFLGAYALAVTPEIEGQWFRTTGFRENRSEQWLADYDWFISNIRRWCLQRNVQKWEDARDILVGLVWPERAWEEDVAREVWAEAFVI
jgi:hypothetical protein